MLGDPVPISFCPLSCTNTRVLGDMQNTIAQLLQLIWTVIFPSRCHRCYVHTTGLLSHTLSRAMSRYARCCPREPWRCVWTTKREFGFLYCGANGSGLHIATDAWWDPGRSMICRFAEGDRMATSIQRKDSGMRSEKIAASAKFYRTEAPLGSAKQSTDLQICDLAILEAFAVSAGDALRQYSFAKQLICFWTCKKQRWLQIDWPFRSICCVKI